MAEHEYERWESCPDIEKTYLTPGELEVLSDTAAHLPRRYVRKFNDSFNGTTKRNREAAKWLAGIMVGMTAVGFLLVEFSDTPTPRYDVQAEADAQVLANPQALRLLGLCSSELRAEVNYRKTEKKLNRLPNDGLSITEYEQAADLAARSAVDCRPLPTIPALYETTIQGKTVDVWPAEITQYNLDDACSQLQRYNSDPDAAPLSSSKVELRQQDITNQQSLLISAGQICPQAGVLDVSHK